MMGGGHMSGPPPSAPVTVEIPLSPPGGMKRFLGGGKRGEHRLTLTPQEVVVEHSALQAPLRFAPGSVAVGMIDPGPADAGNRATGRFPVLRRLSATAVVSRDEGIEGWLWTSLEGTAFTVLSDDAPNIAFIFSPPLPAERLEGVVEGDLLAEIAKRSPLGQPALFGLLLRADKVLALEAQFERFGFRTQVTDREVPPTQRKHLADDKAANPSTGGITKDRAKTSIAPPGFS
jgi:hypothetical protein